MLTKSNYVLSDFLNLDAYPSFLLLLSHSSLFAPSPIHIHTKPHRSLRDSACRTCSQSQEYKTPHMQRLLVAGVLRSAASPAGVVGSRRLANTVIGSRVIVVPNSPGANETTPTIPEHEAAIEDYVLEPALNKTRRVAKRKHRKRKGRDVTVPIR